jgi:hypothetical protein
MSFLDSLRTPTVWTPPKHTIRFDDEYNRLQRYDTGEPTWFVRHFRVQGAVVYDTKHRMCSLRHVREYCLINLRSRTDMVAVTNLSHCDNFEIVWCEGSSLDLMCNKAEQLSEDEIMPILEVVSSVWYPPGRAKEGPIAFAGFDWTKEGF